MKKYTVTLGKVMFSVLDLTKPPITWAGEAVDREQAESLAITASPNGYRVKKVEEHE